MTGAVGGSAADRDADRGTGPFAETHLNIFATDDGPPNEDAGQYRPAASPPRPAQDDQPEFRAAEAAAARLDGMADHGRGAPSPEIPAQPEVGSRHEMKQPLHLGRPENGRSLSEMPFVSIQTDRPADITTQGEMQVPPPAAGRGANRSGRVKTRLLGFNPESLGLASPFEKAESRANAAFPVGWLAVVAGPGRGASFPLHDGVARIGRGDDQTVCLNFGDNSISRDNHVSVAFDAEQNAFFIGQSGRSNIVRLNNKPLLSTEQVRTGDQIRVGETTLRFVALCGEGFSWATNH